MTDTGKLLALIEPSGDLHVAAFVGKPAAKVRRPAMRAWPSRHHAREWVEAETSTVDLPMELVGEVPGLHL